MKKIVLCQRIVGLMQDGIFECCFEKLDDYADLLTKIGEQQGFQTTRMTQMSKQKFDAEYYGKRNSAILSYQQIAKMFEISGITKKVLKGHKNDFDINNVVETGCIFLGLLRHHEDLLIHREESIINRVTEIRGVRKTFSLFKQNAEFCIRQELEKKYKEQKEIFRSKNFLHVS